MSFNRIHIEGALGGTEERWSTSVAFAGPGATGVVDPSELSNWCDAILTELDTNATFSGGLKNMIGSTSNYDRVSAYFYPSVNGNATSAGESTLPAVAGSGTVVLPFQSSLVVTLQTGIPGRSFRGRMYWPFITSTMTNGRINTSSVTLAQRAEYFAALLEAIGAAAETLPSMAPRVVSKTQEAVTLVTSVRVGNVMDTQRRRRDALTETFGTANVG